MRKLWLLVAVIFLSGCLVRTYTVKKTRVDTDLSGNQGYIFGEGAPKEVDSEKAKRLSDKRKVSVVEWELGFGKPKFVREGLKSEEEESADIGEEEEMAYRTEAAQEKVGSAKEAKEGTYEFYTIQKNDTLQKISYKFYGTSRKWKQIFDANQDKLKDPNKIYPGLTIKIPRL